MINLVRWGMAPNRTMWHCTRRDIWREITILGGSFHSPFFKSSLVSTIATKPSQLLPLLFRIIAPLLALALLFACQSSSVEEEDKPIEFELPADFELEELYSASDHDQGTWVSLAEGPKGIMFACDQRGDIYRFPVPPVGQVVDSTSVDTVTLDIGYAHGLLWAFNSLYVIVNREWADTITAGSGVYRLQDTDGDDRLDKMEMLLQLEGAGEHGPHSMVVGPSGEDLYFIAGNHTLIPDDLLDNSRVPTHWDEDNLLPPYLDARGHANDIEAPGGWIARTDPQGESWEIISAGYRNPFDIAFNEQGELFTFDADMEWDFGMPWYRPIRVCHVTSGSEYGWRTGSGKWPVYYPDNLPAVVNLGQGSPTSILMTDQLKMPAKWQKGLLVSDWSFGTMYFVDLKPQGSTYTGTIEEFFSGVPLPITDAIAGSDGHLYFATGGRNLESHFYRLRYVGTDSTTAVASDTEETLALRALRQELEQYHQPSNRQAITLAWQHLNHSDRFIRFAARTVLEHQSPRSWQGRFMREQDAVKTIHGAIALARSGQPSQQSSILSRLGRIDWNGLSHSQKLDLLRAYALVCIRMGPPAASDREALLTRLRALFPSKDMDLDRELSQLLIFLHDDEATDQLIQMLEKHTSSRTTFDIEMLSEEVSSRSEQYGPMIKEVRENMPPTEAIFYATILSHADTGWTADNREQYFQWFYDVLASKGGMSFKAFMENIRRTALSHVPTEEREHYEELSGVFSPGELLASLPQPEGPGQAYNMYDIGQILKDRLEDYEGTVADGKRIYEAALCSSCHRMKGEGGSSGPDLTQINTRFKRGDIINAIFSPNDEISDQYEFTLFTLKEDRKMAGKVFSEDDDKVVLMPNPYTTTHKVEIAQSDILDRGPSPVSPMPPGLFNRLNPEEIRHLMAYLLSGADEEHVLYGGEVGKEAD